MRRTAHLLQNVIAVAECPVLRCALQPVGKLLPAVVAVENSLHGLLLRHNIEQDSSTAAVGGTLTADNWSGVSSAPGERGCSCSRLRRASRGRCCCTRIEPLVRVCQYLL